MRTSLIWFAALVVLWACGGPASQPTAVTPAVDPAKRFWAWFSQDEKRLFEFESDKARVLDDIEENLSDVNPDLEFELGPIQDGRREFVISAGGLSEVAPDVERLYACRPELSRFTVTRYRPRREPTDLSLGGVSVPYDRVFFKLRPDGRYTAIDLYIPGFSNENEAYGALGFLYLDQVLGEETVMTRAGEINFHDQSGPDFKGARPLAELRAAFDKLTR